MANTNAHMIQLNQFPIRIHDFTRAEAFYFSALNFDLWIEDYPPSIANFRIGWLKSGAWYSYPAGYIMCSRKHKEASLFIPGLESWLGYPRVLFTDDVGGVTEKVLLAGGEVYRPTKFRRMGERGCLSPVAYHTFFEDTEGNVTEVCGLTDVGEAAASSSHVSDSFASSQGSC